MQARYLQQPVDLSGIALTFDEPILLRALVKYGRALAHTIAISYELTRQIGMPVDLELSIDETDTPTSIHEHFFIANELIRCNIPVVSLAPRFIGKFQKGVDYIGDPSEFERELIQHVAIMKHFGTYKFSIHTGSDKFSIYPIIARHTEGHVHVKTAGTSYVEALRVIAGRDPALFRQILSLACARFEKDRKTYFLDAQLSNVPSDAAVPESALPALLDHFDTRQVLHVTFGSILDAFHTEISSFISAYEQDYHSGLEAHFARHIAPFTEKVAL